MWHNQSLHEDVLEDYFVKIVLSIWVKVGEGVGDAQMACVYVSGPNYRCL